MREPEFTTHAAKRILERGLDPKAVLSVAKNAMRLSQTGRIKGRGLKMVMDGHVIVTVMVENPRADANIRYGSIRKRLGL